MPAIKLEEFGGQFPAWEGHLLPKGQATYAKNGFLFSGSLIGWREPKPLRNLLNTAARRVFRVPTVTQAQAHALLVFKLQPNDGDTLVVGDLTYTWRTTFVVISGGDGGQVTGLPQEVLIGTDTTESARNFAAALTADNGQNTNAGNWYGDNTVANEQVKSYLPDTPTIPGLPGPTPGDDFIGATDYQFVNVGANDFGAAFNLIKVTESTGGVRTPWLYDILDFAHTTTTYRGGVNPTFDTSITSPSVWLEFNDPDTDVIKSPVVEDEFNRFYWASPSEPPQYNTYNRIQAGSPAWLLGVPPPGCAPVVDVTGGGNSLTLGNDTSSGEDLAAKPNRVYLIKVTPTGATQIQDITWIGDPGNFPTVGFPDAHWVGLLYSDLNGAPDVLLNTGQIITGLKADQNNVSPFVNPTNLSANTDYWIGIAVDSQMASFFGGPTGQGFDMVSWPNTFTNGPNPTAPVGQLGETQVTSDGNNPNDGDVFTLGSWTYRFKNTITAGSFRAVDVHIGANASATLVNLEHAINGTGGTPGTDYSAGLGAHDLVTASAPVTLAMVITLISSATPADFVVTVITGSTHFKVADATMQDGYQTGLKDFNMFADALSSDVIESRSYVYTWVSEYGEEGPPSPPVLLDGWSNGVWTLQLWQPPPNDQGVLRDLKKINIYRTVPGQGGATVFFYVTTVDVGTTEFIDQIPNNTVALNDQLQSTNWFPPPENLQGITVLQNGMVAGFVGTALWFCEPYRPHAWPPSYVLTMDFPIVGLGLTNGALVVCTNANPFVINGSAPSTMAQIRCADVNPCVSRGSILSGDGAVTYCSPLGLIQVTSAGVATNTTDLWFTREKWEQLVPLKFTRAIPLASSYYCLGALSPDGLDNSVAQQGFTVELAQDNTSFTIWPQPGGHRLGFETLDSPTNFDVDNIMIDPWSGVACVVSDRQVWYFDFADPAPTLKVATWKSKVFQQNAKRSYSAMKVFFSVLPGTPALNATRFEEDTTNPFWGSLQADRWAIIKTWADLNDDGSFVLVDAREVRKSGEILRIVDGFKGDNYYWEIQTRVPISNVQIGTSIKDLAKV